MPDRAYAARVPSVLACGQYARHFCFGSLYTILKYIKIVLLHKVIFLCNSLNVTCFELVISILTWRVDCAHGYDNFTRERLLERMIRLEVRFVRILI